MNDDEIKSKAIEFAKHNKSKIARHFTDPIKYKFDDSPISVFMAGSPGAGKTEFSKSLINILERGREHGVVRIDGDEIRSQMPMYDGSNSHLFQGAVSLVVEKIHDFVLHQNQSFVLDGTFSNYEKAVDNIKRSWKKERSILILYVYQRPNIAWEFTKKREEEEGRHIPKSAFIEQFLKSRETVENIGKNYSKGVSIFLVKKDFTQKTEEIHHLEFGKIWIDYYINEVYTKDDLEEIL